MIRTGLICLVVVGLLGAPLVAAPVTVEQCLTGARQAALEARSRELLLKLGDYERRLDPAAASAVTRYSPPSRSTTSKTDVPIDPVEPRMAIPCVIEPAAYFQKYLTIK